VFCSVPTREEEKILFCHNKARDCDVLGVNDVLTDRPKFQNLALAGFIWTLTGLRVHATFDFCTQFLQSRNTHFTTQPVYLQDNLVQTRHLPSE